ncbi:uncharacterized protein LOC106466756 [Limulus polyphemus]|uniref:Uncharacterized protein LOC106466756 n=1 Tax=Limulus polyphemus TaxID=6850 RepID=A0ABM1T3U0_LIMPO|nr:uncharacterized protein LOC106466756 [Limulus polyphemus]XP_022250544.1 uncharacterized protein LOC106466756 [Limulus polyphemus]XP_022250545.1 uncharacterized protein LOC106466756 [Limulus polyphemus]XP_022250546.1 uncharacterized protein LOC106466756 [Limulus polyphemus]XP_022250547.1 uncharacterized protein LOC106466756 [Limulus polyphemus]XP_022250548.1 uncharacterized protein LOC106466756 [Limulus polyphemus]XP_022250549.1 uncharacterized protein LOC106466756 [Limulus polyphemus]XP_0
MDDELITTCREASGELDQDNKEIWSSVTWSFTEFIQQFNLLHDGLHKLQSAVSEVEDEEKRSLVVKSVQEELQKKGLRLKLFNDQAQQLGKRYPNMKDEVSRRVNLLNNKWEAVEQAVNPHKPQQSQDGIFQEVAHQMRCLRRWLREAEDKLHSPAVSLRWKLQDVENKYREQQVLQKEIEARGKYVSSLLKLCERLGVGPADGVLIWDNQRVRRVASNLEHRWHALWLRSLEWQCVLEELINKYKSGFVPTVSSLTQSVVEEPLNKYPRLSFEGDENLFQTFLNMEDQTTNSEHSMQLNHPEEGGNDKGVMVGCTGIPELKAECGGNFRQFEIIQDVGYSSESSTHLSNDERQEFIKIYSYSPVPQGMSKLDNFCQHSMLSPLPPPTEDSGFISHSSKGKNSKDVTSLGFEVGLLYSTPPEGSCQVKEEGPRNVKTVCDHMFQLGKMEICHNLSSSIISTHTSGSSNSAQLVDQKAMFLSTSSPEMNRDAIRDPVVNSENMITEPSQMINKSDKVHDWLKQCKTEEGVEVMSEDSSCGESVTNPQASVDSSCDASGECTTNDSDSEESVGSSEMNCSLALSRSGTGSVETVVQAQHEELFDWQNHTGSVDVSPKALRRKKRSTKIRPRSVTESDQGGIWNFSTFSIKTTSEGALNTMASPVKIAKHFRSVDEEHTPLSKRKHQHHNWDSSSPIFHQSDSGSDSFSPSSKHAGSGSSCFHSSRQQKSTSQNSNRCESSHNKFRNSSNCRRRSSYSSKTSKSSKAGSGSSSSELKQIYACAGLILSNMDSDSSLTTNQDEEQLKFCESEVSLRNIPTEDQGSQSDQVWDNFQEPEYLSEPYSESNAEDAIKKLEGYGDDYHAFLGCQSDSSSRSEIMTHSQTKLIPRSSHQCLSSNTLSLESFPPVDMESDSDIDDFHHILEESEKALNISSKHFQCCTLKDSSIPDAQFSELIVTCQTYLRSLREIEENMDASSHHYHMLPPDDLERLKGHVKQWKKFRYQLLKHQPQEQKVMKELEKLRMKLNNLSVTTNQFNQPSSLADLEERIESLQTLLSTLHDTKNTLLEVNLQVHRLVTESGLASSPLKEDVTALYQLWDDVYELTGSQLTELQNLKQRWSNRGNQDEPLKECSSHLNDTVLHLEQSETKVLFKEMKGQDERSVSIPQSPPVESQSDIGGYQKINTEEKGIWVTEVMPLSPTFRSVATSPDPSLETSPFVTKCRAGQTPFWRRVMRFAVPIQVALVFLCCVACLLEPHCCDIQNNFRFSLSPQLRYIRGPPPV